MLRIGNVSLPFPAYLAPMAGVSDLPFRTVNRRFGCPLAFTEMISTHALAYENPRTVRMLATDAEDRPLGIQLVGNEESFMVRAATALEGFGFDVLDLNAACPVRKVTRQGHGAALMKDPALLERILRALVKHSPVPVTIKIRSGWDRGSVNAREVALRAEDAGVAAICVHGRTREQGYHGEVDYEVIREVKTAVRVPVVGSGNVFSLEGAVTMRERTGCDGVAVARGALGNPWIFAQIKGLYEGSGTACRPSPAEVAATMRWHLDRIVARHGDKIGILAFRKFVPWYTRGLLNAKLLRERAFRANSTGELLGILQEVSESVWAPGTETRQPRTRSVSL